MDHSGNTKCWAKLLLGPRGKGRLDRLMIDLRKSFRVGGQLGNADSYSNMDRNSNPWMILFAGGQVIRWDPIDTN